MPVRATLKVRNYSSLSGEGMGLHKVKKLAQSDTDHKRQHEDLMEGNEGEKKYGTTLIA